jgi:uncharacterized protein (DUF433 family)
MVMNYRERIVRDPHIVGGEPVLKGTRVTLRTVLASLAEGATTAEILADFRRCLKKTFGRSSRLPRRLLRKTSRWPSCPSRGEHQA